ncbi:AAA family ATPase [Pantoea dispersa]|uniref:AAA family ATPase n=1 Tax=Pantoea dispersa TaxID=59814 RepID=UPI003527DCD8
MNTTDVASPEKATLHLLCGKIASGKSTLCAKLGAAPRTIIISEDRWLAALYADEMHTVADYVQYSSKLRYAMKPHLVSLLNAGMSVVLDFPANTPASREWMLSIIKASGAANHLHFLNVPDEVCKSRLRARNAAGTHDFAASDDQFEIISRHFSAPAADEGFNIIEYRS